ncbi:MAG: TIGR03618 family F420-dependent PPOX class oxidoreductase [bacterium]|nr:TIGR03618 family F420-dependent PPOX class oxidoreductase [bacterium]
MLETVPASHRDLLDAAIVVTLVTVSDQAKPHAAAVWRKIEGGHIWIPTGYNTRKHRNIQANPNIVVMTLDLHNPYRYLEIGGVVEAVTEDTDHALLNELTMVYRGKTRFFGEIEPEEIGRTYHGLVLKIRPTRFYAYGP